MAAAKYKRYYQQMKSENEQLFAKFKTVHDLFEQDRSQHQTQFNLLGQELMEIVRDWERRLCAGMSKSFNHYSHTLSEKFKNELRADFPLIDLVGVTISKKKKR